MLSAQNEINCTLPVLLYCSLEELLLSPASDHANRSIIGLQLERTIIFVTSFSHALSDCIFDWILHLIFQSKKSWTLSSMNFKLTVAVKQSKAKLANAVYEKKEAKPNT